MDLTEKTLKKDYKFHGKIVTLRVDDAQLPNGAIVKREVIEHPGGVTIAALTEQNELLFVRQWRYPYEEVVMELPAGKLEKGEDPFEAMKREQMEETGTKCDSYVYLGDCYPSPGYCGELLRLWAGRVSGTGSMNLDEDEFLEVERVPLEEAVQMVMENKLPDAKTQIGVLKTAQLVREGKL